MRKQSSKLLTRNNIYSKGSPERPYSNSHHWPLSMFLSLATPPINFNFPWRGKKSNRGSQGPSPRRRCGEFVKPARKQRTPECSFLETTKAGRDCTTTTWKHRLLDGWGPCDMSLIVGSPHLKIETPLILRAAVAKKTLENPWEE